MNAVTVPKFWIVASVLFMLVASGALAYVLKRDQGEDLTSQIGIDQKLGAQIPMDAKLHDETGKEIKIGSLFGSRPVVITPLFFRCVDTKGTCLLQLEGATKAFKAMLHDNIGEDFDVITISIHPKETPELARIKKAEILKQYKRETAEKGWHFVTGDYDQIQKVLSAAGYRYKYDAVKDRVVHPAGAIILTPQGTVSKYFYGTEYPAKYMRDSIRIAALGQTGGTSEPRFFGCFMYDTSTGKTRLHVRNALKFGGFATLFFLGISIGIMSFKNRRSKEVRL